MESAMKLNSTSRCGVFLSLFSPHEAKTLCFITCPIVGRMLGRAFLPVNFPSPAPSQMSFQNFITPIERRSTARRETPA